MATARFTPGTRFDARVRFATASDFCLDAKLLLAAGTDGTSNTIMFATAFGLVRAAPADSSQIWQNPSVLKSGFGLVLPAAQTRAFYPGRAYATGRLLPHVEQENVVGTAGLSLEQVRVAAVVRVGTDVAVWLEPAGIIAVLIGL